MTAAVTPFDHGGRTHLSLTASGGTPALSYSVTGTYGHETGVLRLPAVEAAHFQTAFTRAPEPTGCSGPISSSAWSVREHRRRGAAPHGDPDPRHSAGADRAAAGVTGEPAAAALMGTYADPATSAYARPSLTADYAMTPAASLVSDYFINQTASLVTSTSTLGLEWQPRSWITVRGRGGAGPGHAERRGPAARGLSYQDGQRRAGQGRGPLAGDEPQPIG